MIIMAGMRYVDGWGTEHYIVGKVPGKTNVFYSSTGHWFLEDGRLHFRVSDELNKFDLTELPSMPAELSGLGGVGPACGPGGCTEDLQGRGFGNEPRGCSE